MLLSSSEGSAKCDDEIFYSLGCCKCRLETAPADCHLNVKGGCAPKERVLQLTSKGLRVYECLAKGIDGSIPTGERVSLSKDDQEKQKRKHGIDDPYKVIYSRTMDEIKYYYKPASETTWTEWFARFGKNTDIVSRGIRAGYHGKSMSISIPTLKGSKSIAPMKNLASSGHLYFMCGPVKKTRSLSYLYATGQYSSGTGLSQQKANPTTGTRASGKGTLDGVGGNGNVRCPSPA